MPFDSLWSLKLWLHHHKLLINHLILDLVVLEVKVWLCDFFLSRQVNITSTSI